jgi:hypothetical protein
MTKYEESERAMRLGPIVATEAERVALLREAINEALEEAAKIVSAAAASAEARRKQAKGRDNREGYIVAEGQWDALAPAADDIRALKKEAT